MKFVISSYENWYYGRKLRKIHFQENIKQMRKILQGDMKIQNLRFTYW